MLDHLVYATPDLGASVEDLARRLGVRPTPGGRHVGRGTRNALLDLGESAYLEIIGPDLEAPEPELPRPFGVDRRPGPCLATWAAKADAIDDRVALARAAGYDPGPVMGMSRDRPDGVVLTWQLTPMPDDAGVSVVPFLIDWGGSPHPSATAAAGCTLVEFHGEHPDPGEMERRLFALGVSLPVHPEAAPALVAVVAGPAGTVELR